MEYICRNLCQIVWLGSGVAVHPEAEPRAGSAVGSLASYIRHFILISEGEARRGEAGRAVALNTPAAESAAVKDRGMHPFPPLSSRCPISSRGLGRGSRILPQRLYTGVNPRERTAKKVQKKKKNLKKVPHALGQGYADPNVHLQHPPAQWYFFYSSFIVLLLLFSVNLSSW